MRRSTIGLIGFIATLALSNEASANTRRLPTEFTNRPLALPGMVLRLDAGHRWPFYDAWFKHVSVRGASDLQFLNPGVSLGVTDGFELGLVTPVRVGPELRGEDPRFHFLYQFVDGRVEVGAFGYLRFGVFDHFTTLFGVPVAIHFSPRIRLDTGGFVQIDYGAAANVNFIAPAQLPIQITRRFYAGPETGLIFYNAFDDGSGVALPLGAFAGYTVGAANAPLGDLYTRFRINDLAEGFAVVELMFGAELFFDL